MDDTRWRNLSVVFGAVCIVLLIAVGVLAFTGKSSPTVTLPPLPSDTGGSALESPTIGLGSAPSGVPGSSATPGATPTPLPTQSAATASVTFNDMTLDAEKVSGATARTFTFISDGYGPVVMQVTKTTPGKSVKICAKVDSSAFSCRPPGINPGFPKASADTAHSVWTITIIGSGGDSPTIDVHFAWPTATPKITLSHGRLQGSSSPGVPVGLNGFSATFQPRIDGDLGVQASWTAITTDVHVALADVTASPAVSVDEQSYTAVGFLAPAYSHAVDPTKTYKVALRNTSADAVRPDLTVQITFP